MKPIVNCTPTVYFRGELIMVPDEPPIEHGVFVVGKKKKLAAKPEAKPDVKTLAGWRQVHEAHGRVRHDAHIHIYDHYACSCGDKFIDPPRP